jgi:transcriptional repressor NrdR
MRSQIRCRATVRSYSSEVLGPHDGGEGAVMHCPFCRHPDSRVVDSRETDEGQAIRRRRSCPECGRRFTTVETAAGSPEVPSNEVGLAILGPLRDLDEVAYLRFASVYRSFSSADDFEREIEALRAHRAEASS